MNITKEQLQQIRDALAYYGHSSVARPETTDALRILDAALAADPQPVAWMGYSGTGEKIVSPKAIYSWMTIPLYTAPVAAPESQPFGYVRSNAAAEILFNGHCETAIFREQGSHTIALYTAPVATPQREWVSLTDQDIEDASPIELDRHLFGFARSIEASLKAKNT